MLISLVLLLPHKLASSRRSVSWGAARKAAREKKFKKAQREELSFVFHRIYGYKFIASIHLAQRVSHHSPSLDNQEAATAHQLVLQVLFVCSVLLFPPFIIILKRSDFLKHLKQK